MIIGIEHAIINEDTNDKFFIGDIVTVNYDSYEDKNTITGRLAWIDDNFVEIDNSQRFITNVRHITLDDITNIRYYKNQQNIEEIL